MKRAALAALLVVAGAACRREPVVLRVGQSDDILTLDPNQKFEVVTDTVAMNIFDSLVEFDAHMTIRPVLASSWENPDEKTWRFHLHPGVRFHDGSALTASDVVFSIERVLHDPGSEMYSFLVGIRTVRALDPLTVEIETKTPSALLPRLSFIYVLPRAAVERQGSKAFFAHPIGSGPYRFVSWEPGKAVTIEAFDSYFLGRPPIRNVQFVVVPSPRDRWNLITTTKPSILLDAPLRQWDDYRSDSHLRLIARPSLTVSYLGMNVTKKPGNPLADLRVRQAIRLALDTKALLSSESVRGHGYPSTQYVPPDVIGFNPELQNPATDPTRARALLAEAGYPSGLDLVVDVEQGGAGRFMAEIIRQEALAGIRLKPKEYGKAILFERIDRGESQLYVNGWICSTGESAELFESSLHTRDLTRGLGRDNGTGYSNPTLDALIERILATVDAAERLDLEKRAMAIAVSDLPLIPLYVQEDRYAMTPDVAWEPRADGEISLPEVRLR